MGSLEDTKKYKGKWIQDSEDLLHKVKFEDCFHCPVEECGYHEHKPDDKAPQDATPLAESPLGEELQMPTLQANVLLEAKYLKRACFRKFPRVAKILQRLQEPATENDESQTVDVEHIDETRSNARRSMKNDGGHRVQINKAQESHFLDWSVVKQCTKCRRKYKIKHNCQEYVCNLCSRTFFRKSDLASHNYTLAHISKEVLIDDTIIIEGVQNLIRKIESKELNDKPLINMLAALVPEFQKIQDSSPESKRFK